MDDSTMLLLDFGDSLFVNATSNFCVKDVLSDSALYGTNGVIRMPLSSYRSTQQVGLQVPLYNVFQKIRSMRARARQIRSRKPGEQWVDWTPPLFSPSHRLAAPWGAHIIADMLEFVDSIANNKEPTIATGERARHVVEVFEKAYASARTGKTQELKTVFA
jgi:predicted dehydrogenase